MTRRYIFTSESVTEGHPDKLADRISDAVLDAVIAEDPDCRVACETLLTTGQAIVAGELRTDTYVEIRNIVRETIKEVGYNDAKSGMDGETCGVLVAIQDQSADIAMGVDEAMEHKKSSADVLDQLGAGDQGMMFGYATLERDDLDTNLMPTPIWLAHRMAERLTQERMTGEMPYLRPDGKTQISVKYEDGRPVGIDTVVISAQHHPEVDTDTLLAPDLLEHVVNPVIPDVFASADIRLLVNPTGRFEIGGPMGDTGLTGRKIIVDSYGGMCSQGGGCFSGKDPTKVDRTGAYMARYAAKNLVASGVLSRCEVRLAYAIGVAHPVSVNIHDYGTSEVDPQKLEELVSEYFDFRPAAIINQLDLRRPIFKQTSSYGHFGRTDTDSFTWERTDRAEELAKLARDL